MLVYVERTPIIHEEDRHIRLRLWLRRCRGKQSCKQQRRCHLERHVYLNKLRVRWLTLRGSIKLAGLWSVSEVGKIAAKGEGSYASLASTELTLASS